MITCLKHNAYNYLFLTTQCKSNATNTTGYIYLHYNLNQTLSKFLKANVCLGLSP